MILKIYLFSLSTYSWAKRNSFSHFLTDLEWFGYPSTICFAEKLFSPRFIQTTTSPNYASCAFTFYSLVL